jgi:hypothetical protein
MNFIDVSIAGGVRGFPILPHGAGAFYNMFGAAINVPTSGLGFTYGEYMPYGGQIVGAAINLISTARAPATPAAQKYYAACYGGGGFPFAAELIGSKAAGADEGSIFYNTTGATGFEAVAIPPLIAPNPGPINAIPFGRGSYIGIFVDFGGVATQDVAIEGTLYLNIQ